MSDESDPTAVRNLDPRTPRRCAGCARLLDEPYGWCANCQTAFCLVCGRQHFCTERCRDHGCIAGLCVRLVVDGHLSQVWGLPEPT